MSMKRDEIMKAVETLVEAVKTDEGRQIISKLNINIIINNFNSAVENSSFEQTNFKIDDKEEWRDIKGYEGLYQVSTLGNVRSRHSGEWRLLKLWLDSRNHYYMVTLCKKGKHNKFTVHSLVAKTFLPNENNLPVVDHKDANRHNNNVNNLEWVTYGENISRSWRNGHRDGNNAGIKNGRAKLTKEEINYIRGNYKSWDKKYGAVPLSKKFGVSPQTIINVALGKTYNSAI